MTHPLSVGQTVDRYRVERFLGEGGMAYVVQVRHLQLGTVHALKVLQLDSPMIRHRFMAEGRAQAAVDHPNVLRVSDVLEVNGVPALLMPFVDGGSLADVLQDGPLAPDIALPLFIGIVRGVAAAHAQGLVHRDLTPGNVLLALEDDGDPFADAPPDLRRATPKVADFGLVRVSEPAGHGTPRTEMGLALGTLGYCAPEQIRDARNVDARADIFSLGALLYSMVTGDSPFASDDRLVVLSSIAAGQFVPASTLRADLPAAFDAVIARCLAVDPSERFPTADALREAVEALLSPAYAGPAPTPSVPAVEEKRRAPSYVEAPPLAAAPSSSAERTATVKGLVVDRSGKGHVVDLVVVLVPGGQGVQSLADVDRDANVAAQLAVAVALGVEARAWGVRWTVRGSAFVLHGTSLGLAIAVATYAALTGAVLPADEAFTGGIDLDGQVVSVHGVPAKVRAAAMHGLRRVTVPRVDVSVDLNGVPIEVRGVSRFVEVVPSARPIRSLPGRQAALLLLPIVMALFDMTAGVDAWLVDPILRWVRGPLPVEDVVLVEVPAGPDLRERRGQVPLVLQTLAEGGATAVFFDIALSSPMPVDEKLAETIAELGIPVAVPVRFVDERPVLPGTKAVGEVARLGTVEARQDSLFGHVRSIPVRRYDVDGQTWWHLAVWTAAAHIGARNGPLVEQNTLTVGPLRNPVWVDEVFLPPVGEVLSFSVGEVAAAAAAGQFHGKAVVVGVTGGKEDIHRTPSGPRYGAEIEAGVVQVLLRQAGLQRVPIGIDMLAAGAATVLPWAVARSAAPRWVSVLLVVVCLSSAVLLLWAGYWMAMVPLFLGAALGLVLGWRDNKASTG